MSFVSFMSLLKCFLSNKSPCSISCLSAGKEHIHHPLYTQFKTNRTANRGLTHFTFYSRSVNLSGCRRLWSKEKQQRSRVNTMTFCGIMALKIPVHLQSCYLLSVFSPSLLGPHQWIYKNSLTTSFSILRVSILLDQNKS